MFYDNYVTLCNTIDKAPSAVAEELGFSRTAVNGWKHGKYPTDATIQKIAVYFGRTVEEIRNDKDLSNTAESPQALGFDDFTYAMYNEGQNLTEEDKSLLLQMARQLNDKNKKSGKAN